MNIPLPRVPAKLADLIGSDNTLALIDYARQGKGKCCIYVPLHPNPRNALVRLIGMEATAKLAKEYAGQQIELPKFKAIDRAQRAAESKRLAAEGMTRANIARHLGITARQVGNLLNT